MRQVSLITGTYLQLQNKGVTGKKCAARGRQSRIMHHLCMATAGDEAYCGDHLITYRNIRSLCHTPETKGAVSQKQASKQNHRERDQT